MKVLWLSPNFNHYKARFLNLLVEKSNIELTVIVGSKSEGIGHEEIEADWNFNLTRINVSKKRFGYSFNVMKIVLGCFGSYDWVMIPREKKNIALIFCAYLFRKISFENKTKLVSYNHPFFNNHLSGMFNTMLLMLFYRIYNRIIFYTEYSAVLAIESGLIKKEKAFWANNTLDEKEIQKHYNYTKPNFEKPNLLFIGRLIPSKEIALLIKYYQLIKKELPNLSMDIVGDGPEMKKLKTISRNVPDITIHGTKNKEIELAPLFEKCSCVFIPGHSGLSINHAFHYGRPYLTLIRKNHAPEIHYLKDGLNGYILEGNEEANIARIVFLLTNQEKLNSFSKAALETGKNLSIDNWCEQINRCLSS